MGLADRFIISLGAADRLEVLGVDSPFGTLRAAERQKNLAFVLVIGHGLVTMVSCCRFEDLKSRSSH